MPCSSAWHCIAGRLLWALHHIQQWDEKRNQTLGVFSQLDCNVPERKKVSECDLLVLRMLSAEVPNKYH